MLKLSAALGVLGLALLLWSFMPSAASGPDQVPSTSEAANAARGKLLFAAKGCGTCHANTRAVAASGECCAGVGPDLSSYTNDPAWLRHWLADPAAVKPGTQMPDLDLSAAEIEDLIAFLNEPR